MKPKKSGSTLSGYERQAKRYSDGLPDFFRPPFDFLPFLYQATANEIRFTNELDPIPKSRQLFAFHKPETLARWTKQREKTLNWRLKNKYQPLEKSGLWKAQIKAIQNLEDSLGTGRERALIQMATSSGKTFTAVHFAYRMLRDAGVNRILFLVDRKNLAKQTEAEFQKFETPDDGRKFSEIYGVQRMTSNTPDNSSSVIITTIQRVYSILRGEPDMDPELEQDSMFETEYRPDTPPKEVSYNLEIPVEYFDVIIVDECHRSIYNVWRQVLEYFDAKIIGLTATPSKQTFGFFRENLVMEYTRQQAVIDGVNVPGEVFVIRTQITEEGGEIPARFTVPVRDKKSRDERMVDLDEDFSYTANDLDRKALSKSQIQMVLRTYRDRLFTDIFPARYSADTPLNERHVPKTLIFAKDDAHAEEIVHIARDVFREYTRHANEFCEKVTYKADDPEQVIRDFRTQYNPRITVTVDMIATGTDVKPIEVLIFMRLVKSAGLFEQMQGRGVRVIKPSDLKQVTPGASEKTRFIIVDAVGAVDEPKADIPTMERKPSASFDKLLQRIALGTLEDDYFITLANRLSRLQSRLNALDERDIEAHSNGLTLREIAHRLLEATSVDRHIEAAREATGQPQPDPDDIRAAEENMKREAASLLNSKLRKTILNHQKLNNLELFKK